MFAIITGVAIILAGIRVAVNSIRVPRSYAVRVEFGEMPSNDEQFEVWLARQPGVRNVCIARRSGAIVIYWTMNQTLAMNPPRPDVLEPLNRFGYRGISNYNPDWLD
jgi:hypothetical protein